MNFLLLNESVVFMKIYLSIHLSIGLKQSAIQDIFIEEIKVWDRQTYLFIMLCIFYFQLHLKNKDLYLEYQFKNDDTYWWAEKLEYQKLS